MKKPEAIIEIWAEPAPMDTGAPEPVLVREADRLWAAYRAHDPDFPGWDHPSAGEYLANHRWEPFAVLSFEGVHDSRLGPPSDEGLHEHPLYGAGLKFYDFHRVRYGGEAASLWISMTRRSKFARMRHVRWQSSSCPARRMRSPWQSAAGSNSRLVE